MNFFSLWAIPLGASLGAMLRWLLGIGMNHWVVNLPLGTLAANLTGGYLVGIAVIYFGHSPQLDPAWRLFIITGFLGGLTTFSTFSAENVQLLIAGRFFPALLHASLHLAGSLLATWLGILSCRAWIGAGSG